MCLGIILMVRSGFLYSEYAYSVFFRHHWHVRRGSMSVLHASHRVPGAQCVPLPPKVRRTLQAPPLTILTRSTSHRLRFAIPWDRSPPTNPRLKFPRPLLQRNPARPRHLLRQQTVVLEHPPPWARAGHHHRRRWRRRKSERAPRHRRPDAAETVRVSAIVFTYTAGIVDVFCIDWGLSSSRYSMGACAYPL